MKNDLRYYGLLTLASLTVECGWYYRLPRWVKKRRSESKQKKIRKYTNEFQGEQFEADRAATHFSTPGITKETRHRLFSVFMRWEEKTEKGLPRYLLIMALRVMGQEYSERREDAFLMRSSYMQMVSG